MAKVVGDLLIKGTVDGYTYYQVGGTWYMRTAGRISKKRFRYDPAFEESRKAGAEFGRAAKAAMVMRKAFAGTAATMANKWVQGRITGRIRALMETDTKHDKGERQIMYCDMGGMRGFEWNKHASFGTMMLKDVEGTVDTESGMVRMTVPAVKPETDICGPQGATHYEFVMGGAAINFASEKFCSVEARTGWRRLDEDGDAVVLNGVLADVERKKVFGGIGIRFGMEVNGKVVGMVDNDAVGFVYL